VKSKLQIASVVALLLASAGYLLYYEVTDSRIASIPAQNSLATNQRSIVDSGNSETTEGSSIRLLSILMVKGSQIAPSARMSTGSQVSAEFKIGDFLVGHWKLNEISDDEVVIGNTKTGEILHLGVENARSLPTLTAESLPPTASAPSKDIFSDPRLKFASKPRPNLNKPDIVDQATWEDMKSKYGL